MADPTAPSEPPAASRPPSRARRRLFRLAAVLLGLSVFAFVELLCVAFDWGRPADFDDPYVGFSTIHPLFALDEAGTEYRVTRARRRWFAEEGFPAQKPAGGYRIFCFGGSTVQGNPWSKETSFTTWLELSLQAAEPRRGWDVVNCGGISYASYRLVPLLEECLHYQPDLVILCSGHNEFLEDRTYGHIKHPPPMLGAVERRASRLRSYVLLRQALWNATRGEAAGVQRQRDVLGPEADALLDYHDGLRAYRRDDEWREGVIAHYEHNLRRMVAICERRGIPVIVVRPPSNLSDSPPFKSEHRAGITSDEIARWDALVAEAQDSFRSDVPQAVELLSAATEIDGQYAATWYELGKCYEALHRHEQAREAFVHARDHDICPLRMLSPMEAALDQIAADAGVPLLNAHALLESRCPEGVLGDYLLVDHVHPSIEGYQLIGDALAEEVLRIEDVAPAADWQMQKQAAWKQHFDSLDNQYFHRGQQHLRALRNWTQGRADGPPIQERLPQRFGNE